MVKCQNSLKMELSMKKILLKMKGGTLLMIFLVLNIRLVFDFKTPSSAQNCNEVKQS